MSMQKYGPSNSSGIRMIWAPWAAASRTSRSAVATLSSTPSTMAICNAATVTLIAPIYGFRASAPRGSGLWYRAIADPVAVEPVGDPLRQADLGDIAAVEVLG